VTGAAPAAHQRRATSGDAEALAAFEEANFRSDRISPRQWRYQLRQPTIEVWMDEIDGGVLRGVLVLFFRRRSRAARIYSLAVDPAWRGRGIGNALLERAAASARERGCQRLVLEVRVDNEIALGLYRRAGFACLRTLPGYYADGSAALRLEKTLPQQRRTAAADHRQMTAAS
jgi:ribosomal protein S18 acetylase RimI-like enzyme